MAKLLLALVALMFVFGCAHHRDVRPGADGIHRVVIATDDPDNGTRQAISEANHYCKEKDKEAAFLDEKSAYKGDLDEKDYKNYKRATTVAKTVGGAVWVFGGQTERTLGGLAGIGGAAGDAALGNGYTVEMRFKCQ